MKPNTHYLSGFNNQHYSEALPNALPLHQNSPQHVAYDLYAEQLSGSAFTRSRHHNLRSWLYRIQPSVVHGEFQAYAKKTIFFDNELLTPMPPNQLRWSALPQPQHACDFIDGITHIAVAGNVQQPIAALYIYQFNQGMSQRYFYDADGELVFVLQQGELTLNTEFGCISAQPGEIVIIPRGIKFQIEPLSPLCSGYLCENFTEPFTLPELGVIGANGLANPRDFYYPTAQFQDLSGEFELICKFQNHLWSSEIKHSPLNVVAWHGNYAPYKYDLRYFNTVNTVSYDHADPSIFTVLSAMSPIPGIANLDLVIFPERWSVAEHTFRPPYYHRNIMSELMGLIYGEYDAKTHGFEPGGISIHNCMSAHGPDSDTYGHAIKENLIPQRYHDTLAFMFESCQIWQVTRAAYEHAARQTNYAACWQDLPKCFST